MSGRIYDGRRTRRRAGIVAIAGTAVGGVILAGLIFLAWLAW